MVYAAEDSHMVILTWNNLPAFELTKTQMIDEISSRLKCLIEHCDIVQTEAEGLIETSGNCKG